MPRLKITILLILSLTGLTRLTVQAQIPHVSQQKIDSLTAIVADMPDDTVKAYTLAMICSNHSNADSTLKYAQELYSLSFKLGPKWQAMAEQRAKNTRLAQPQIRDSTELQCLRRKHSELGRLQHGQQIPS